MRAGHRTAIVVLAMAIIGGVSASSAAASTFSCRASALRVKTPLTGTVEPIVANKNSVPCKKDAAALIAPTTIGPVTAAVLTANTDQANPTGFHPTAFANAEAAGVLISLPGAVIRADVLQEGIQVQCTTQGQPVASGGSGQLLGLTINGQGVTIPPNDGTITIPASPLVTVVVNRKTQSGSTFTRQALYIDSPLLMSNIVVAEAQADAEVC